MGAYHPDRRLCMAQPSELIREAERLYIQRQSQWNDLFQLGDMAVQKQHLNEHDVAAEIEVSVF
ncbi:MAG: hypothetical protein ACOYLR_11900 [Chlorobium sp.]